ncbi:HAD family hydrolase [Halomonas sp. PGE1]|uniref:HAD family hydrolase n=1 Tax=Halomonas sp. PGE1 TaxID=2730360 RepID=UPI0032D59F14
MRRWTSCWTSWAGATGWPALPTATWRSPAWRWGATSRWPSPPGSCSPPKPDPRPFLAALARLGTPPSRALHVGDSWAEDALPARRLGMQAAWIGPDDRDLPAGIHRLDHVRELPELIAWLERRR